MIRSNLPRLFTTAPPKADESKDEKFKRLVEKRKYRQTMEMGQPVLISSTHDVIALANGASATTGGSIRIKPPPEPPTNAPPSTLTSGKAPPKPPTTTSTPPPRPPGPKTRPANRQQPRARKLPQPPGAPSTTAGPQTPAGPPQGGGEQAKSSWKTLEELSIQLNDENNRYHHTHLDTVLSCVVFGAYNEFLSNRLFNNLRKVKRDLSVKNKHYEEAMAKNKSLESEIAELKRQLEAKSSGDSNMSKRYDTSTLSPLSSSFIL